MAFGGSKERLEFETAITGVARAKSDLDILGRAGKRAFEDIEEGADDARSAVERYADAVDRDSDEVKTEVEGMARAYEALARAAGPELAARSGAAMEKMITDLRDADVPFQAIIDDADRLGSSLRNLDSTTSSIDDIDRKLKNTAVSGDQSRSVLANLAGNAAQELPGISTALGPVNMAISQLTEYATEGSISMANLIKVAGPMLAVAGGIALVSKVLTDKAEREAKAREVTKEYTEAILDQTGALRENIAAVTAKNFVDNEAIRSAVEHGVSASALADAVQDSTVAVGAYGDAVDSVQGDFNFTADVDGLRDAFASAGLEGTSLADTLLQLAGSGEYTYSELKDLLGVISGYQGNLADAGVEAALTAAINRQLGIDTEGAADAAGHLSSSSQDVAASLRDQFDAASELVPSQIELRDAMLQSADATAAYNATMADAAASDQDKIAAGDDLFESYRREAEAAGRTAAAQSGAAAGSAAAVRASADGQIGAWLRLGQNVAPGSQVYNDIQAHVRNLAATTGPRYAEVRALINQGDLSAAARALDNLTRDRVIQVAVNTTGMGGVAKFAAGGNPDPHAPFIAGEDGPELIAPLGFAAHVSSASDTERLFTKPSGGLAVAGGVRDVNFYITVNNASDGDAVVDAIRLWGRRNGRGVLRELVGL